MTKRIYVRGNIGLSGTGCRIYDADTDRQLDDVGKITIVATAGAVQAQLVCLNSPNVAVDVVAGPPAPRTGETFHLVTLDADKRTLHCDTVHIAKVQSLTMNDDGTLSVQGGQVTSMRDAVSDANVKQAIDPYNELVQSAFRALTATLRQAIINPLVRKLLGPATGGVVTKAASRTPVNTGRIPLFSNPVPKKATSCPECFDTGLTNGFMHPCSKGCTP